MSTITVCSDCGCNEHFHAPIFLQKTPMRQAKVREELTLNERSKLWQLPCHHLLCYFCFEDCEAKNNFIKCPACDQVQFIPNESFHYFGLENDQIRYLDNQSGIVLFRLRLLRRSVRKHQHVCVTDLDFVIVKTFISVC